MLSWRQGAVGHRAPRVNKPAGLERGVTSGSVRKLCELEQLFEAVEALGVLVHKDCPCPNSLFYAVLKECAAKKDLALGRRVHALSVKKGYESDTFLCNHFLRMYASHARMQEVMDVFTSVAHPDAFMWSSIISAHVERGQSEQALQLYHRMRSSSVKPDGHVFVSALRACASAADLESGQLVHADVLAYGLESDTFVCSSLIDMYAKCGSLLDARRLFDGVAEKNVVTWNALISGYSHQGMGQESLHLYGAMQEEGIAAPTSVTFACLLQACASLGPAALEKGKELHAQIRERALETNVFVASSLVNMYAKCGSLEDAERVFHGLGQKNVVAWSAMIAAYSQRCMGQEALGVYSAMQEDGIVTPDSVIFVFLLQACASLGTPGLGKGRQLHAQIRELRLQADTFVANGLVNMYAKCGSIEDAEAVFGSLHERNVVSWNAMIAGYCQEGKGQEALGLYRAMQEGGLFAPDSVTFVSLLQACADVAALGLGMQLHTRIKDQGLQTDAVVARSLIHMYGKCGSMVDAQEVFEALAERDVVAWNALIAGYHRQGDCEHVFDLFLRMTDDGIQPDGITFLSVLPVCSYAGLVNKGQEYFEAMSTHYSIPPTVDHYCCMVDLLGRAGEVEEALALVRTMPVPPNTLIWHTLLGACRKWSNVEVGRHAFEEATKMDKKNAAAYVLMANIYAGAQMWEGAQQIHAMRIGVGAWKQPGRSWWTDMDGTVHTFLVRDKQEPPSVES